MSQEVDTEQLFPTDVLTQGVSGTLLALPVHCRRTTLPSSVLNTEKGASFHLQKQPGPLESFLITRLRESNGVKYTDRTFNSGESRILI